MMFDSATIRFPLVLRTLSADSWSAESSIVTSTFNTTNSLKQIGSTFNPGYTLINFVEYQIM